MEFWLPGVNTSLWQGTSCLWYILCYWHLPRCRRRQTTFTLPRPTSGRAHTKHFQAFPPHLLQWHCPKVQSEDPKSKGATPTYTPCALFLCFPAPPPAWPVSFRPSSNCFASHFRLLCLSFSEQFLLLRHLSWAKQAQLQTPFPNSCPCLACPLTDNLYLALALVSLKSALVSPQMIMLPTSRKVCVWLAVVWSFQGSTGPRMPVSKSQAWIGVTFESFSLQSWSSLFV